MLRRWFAPFLLVQGGKTEDMFLDMYDRAMDGMAARLLKRAGPARQLMLSDWTGYRSKLKMDHLACFTPGMLALGALHGYVRQCDEGIFDLAPLIGGTAR